MTYYRKCPNCGWQDPVAWRGSSYDPDREFADFMEFSAAYPEIAGKIQGFGTKHHLVAGEYVYWRSARKGIVQRIPVVVYRANGNRCRGHGDNVESDRRRQLVGNMKLTELEAA